MKAIIPVAGAGTRLRPFTYTQPKALIPVAGKPILSYIIDELLEANTSEFIFIVGYLGDKIQDFVSEKYPDIKATFVMQTQREGLGHAVYLTREFVKQNEPIFIVLGDSIIDVNFKEIFKSGKSTLGYKKVDDPTKFGIVELDAEGKIKSLVEKPTMPKSNMALVGFYLIKESAALFSCIENMILANQRTNGEYQLTDALMCMLHLGIPFECYRVENWFDMGKGDVLLQTNAQLLKKLGRVHPDAKIENSIIVEPVSIAANAILRNSIIGPDVTVGENTIIENSIIKDSIIGNYTTLKEMTMKSSVIGSDASMTGLSQKLNIGDNTEIDFSR